MGRSFNKFLFGLHPNFFIFFDETEYLLSLYNLSLVNLINFFGFFLKILQICLAMLIFCSKKLLPTLNVPLSLFFTKSISAFAKSSADK